MTVINSQYYTLVRVSAKRGNKVHNAVLDLESRHVETYCGRDGYMGDRFYRESSFPTCEYCSDHDDDYTLSKEDEN